MKILGIDVGRQFTKDSNGNIFQSRATKNEPFEIGKQPLNVNGDKWWIGQGEYYLNTDYFLSDIHKLCVLNSCYLSGQSDLKLVVGLPIGQYSNHKDTLRSSVMAYSSLINDKQINIRDVFVYAQGVSALACYEVFDGIIIDCGSRTVDVALVQDCEVVRADTYYCGCMALYSKIASAINSHYDITLTDADAYGVLVKGLYIDGKKKDISFLNGIYAEHFAEVMRALKLNYPSDTTSKYLIGGGAELIEPVVMGQYKDTKILDDCQFANAFGYYNIGKEVF